MFCSATGTARPSLVAPHLAPSLRSLTTLRPAADGHVTLHQSAAFYGINSMTLGSRVEKSGFEPIDNADLAGKERLLAYFARAVTAFEATGRVRYFPNATFDSEHKAIDTAGGGRSTVSFRKLVVPTSNVQVLLVVRGSLERRRGDPPSSTR